MVRAPARARSMVVPSSRAKFMRPEVIVPPPFSTRRMSDKAVTDLPEPDSPTMATVSPRPTKKDTSRTAATTRSVLRNSIERCSTSIKGDKDASILPGVAEGFVGEALIARSIPRSRLARLLRTDLIDGRAHGDRLRVDLEPQHRWTTRAQRALQRRSELIGASHLFAVGSVGFRQRHEIGIDQIGPVDARRVIALLVHADGAVHAVVDHDENHIQLVLDRGGNFLPVHLKAAVAVP